MTTNTSLINQVLSDPEAPLIVEALSHAIKKEHARRTGFYNSLGIEELKAEFINGEVIIHSPVKKVHNDVSSNLFGILDAFVTEHDLGFVGYEKIMIRLTRNDYEPDVCFFGKEKAAQFEEDTSLFPAPDLVVEVVSPKTETRDRGIKFTDYEKHRVGEYWIINPIGKTVEQYGLDDNTQQYLLIKKSDSGIIRSQAVTDFSVDIPVLFDKHLTQQTIKYILGY